MPETIYLVTIGEYSDYRVATAFTNRSDATGHALAINRYESGAAQVEELHLYRSEQPHGRVLYRALADAQAGVDVLTRVVWDYDAELPEERKRPWDIGGWALTEDNARAWASSYDREAAVKAASDRLSRLRAEKAGIA